MKIVIQISCEIEIQDSWLRECWEMEPVEDERADAISVAVGTLQERIALSAAYDPVSIRPGSWTVVEEGG